jgi:hypothetical protein
LSWLGESPWSADHIVGGLPRNWARRQARVFLHSVLADGSKTARHIWELGQKQGLSERTLRRAKKELSIRSLKGLNGPALQTYWLLPGQQLPLEAVPATGAAVLEPWLEPRRRAFPEATPLDEE